MSSPRGDQTITSHRMVHSWHDEQQQQSSSSFFDKASSAKIIDSPATSPLLGPQQSPTQYSTGNHGHGFGSRLGNRAHALSKIAARRRDGSSETPAESEVPSLSLSHSSASDSYLMSPYHETPPSQTGASVSSIRTVQAQSSNASLPLGGEERASLSGIHRLDAMHRAAASLRLPVEDVYKAMDMVNMIRQRTQASMDEDVPDSDHLQRIYDAVQTEEERLTQIASFRAAYVQAESKRSQMELHHRPPPLITSGLHSLPSPRTLPPLSPLMPHDYSDSSDHDRRRSPSVGTSSHVIPSPREALEILSDSRNPYEQSPISPTGRFPPSSYAYNGQSQHIRRASGSRPLSLPDRSYRSMDDYVNDSQQHPSSSSASLRASHHSTAGRRSMQAPYPPPSLSRPSSRSPLNAGESPQLYGSDTLAFSPGSKRASISSSPLLSTNNNRLQPSSHGPHRRRSGSTTSNQSSLSRRTSTDLLGLGLPRSISPSMAESSVGHGSSVNLSHEEIMARLQRKVKERIAAREASGEVSASVPASPAVGGGATSSPLYNGAPLSPGGGGAQRASDSFALPSTVLRSPSKLRKPRKSASLKVLPRGESRLNEKPLPPLPPLSTELDGMKGVEHHPNSPVSPTGALSGIEALLSAAAIADQPRWS